MCQRGPAVASERLCYHMAELGASETTATYLVS